MVCASYSAWALANVYRDDNAYFVIFIIMAKLNLATM